MSRLISLTVLLLLLTCLGQQETCTEPSGYSDGQSVLHFVTVATQLKCGICALAQSVRHFTARRTMLKVLGLSATNGSNCAPRSLSAWTNAGSAPRLFCKLVFMDHWLHNPSCGIGPTDLVLLTDAYDVLVQQHAWYLLETYRRIARPPRNIVFAGDINCFPFVPWKGYVAKTRRAKNVCKRFGSGLNPYLNGGVYMGPLTHLRNFFDFARRWHAEDDDQALMTLTYLDHKDRVLIDANADLFLCVHGHNESITNPEMCSSDYFSEGGPPRLVPTGARPSVLHFNGPSKDAYFPRCRQLFEQYLTKEASIPIFDVDNNRVLDLADFCQSDACPPP